jgi:hypothetical protein
MQQKKRKKKRKSGRKGKELENLTEDTEVFTIGEGNRCAWVSEVRE